MQGSNLHNLGFQHLMELLTLAETLHYNENFGGHELRYGTNSSYHS